MLDIVDKCREVQAFLYDVKFTFLYDVDIFDLLVLLEYVLILDKLLLLRVLCHQPCFSARQILKRGKALYVRYQSLGYPFFAVVDHLLEVIPLKYDQ